MSGTEVEQILVLWPGTADASTAPNLQSIVNELHRLVFYIIASGDKDAVDLLATALPATERERDTLIIHRYPLGSQLGGYNHFRLLWHSYLALIHQDEFDIEAASSALRLILAVGRSLRRQAERYVVHNIFTAGSYALFYLARTGPEFREAAEWDERAVRWLALDFERSFYDDGGHKERNWGYGAHTIRRLNEIYNFGQATGGLHGREEQFADGLRRAYQFYALTLGPRDIAPGFGDEGLHEMGYVLEKALESRLFPAGTNRDLGVARSQSCLLPGSGIAIMRNGAGDEAAFCNVSFGEFAGWHSHHDLLSMNFWSHGEILLEEVPRFGPYEHPLDRLWRQAEAHNQLVVDGYFYDSRPCVGQDIIWYSDAHVDYFSAFHTAYREVPQDEHRAYVSSDSLIVRRTIVFVKAAGYAVVLDSVRPENGEHFNRATSQWWHSPQAFQVLGHGMVTAGNRAQSGRAGCLLTWARSDSLRRFETGIDFLPEDAQTDIHPPLHDQWHNLRTRTWGLEPGEGCVGFATLLYPFEGEPPAASIRALETVGTQQFRAEVLQVTTPAGIDFIALNPEQLPGFDYGWSAAGLDISHTNTEPSLHAFVHLEQFGDTAIRGNAFFAEGGSGGSA